jgi:hypothetical protein
MTPHFLDDDQKKIFILYSSKYGTYTTYQELNMEQNKYFLIGC